MFLRNREFLKEVIKIIKEFFKYVGFKLNIDKIECILIGCLKSCKNDIFGIKINMLFIKCLGIYIGYNKDECYKKNWIDKCENMKKLYEFWKRRKFIIFGKIEIVNILGISKFIYVVLILLLLNEDVIKKLYSYIFNFIWNNKDRIK